MEYFVGANGVATNYEGTPVSEQVQVLQAKKQLLEAEIAARELRHVDSELKTFQDQMAMESLRIANAEFVNRFDYFPQGFGFGADYFGQNPMGGTFTYASPSDRYDGRDWPFVTTETDLNYAIGLARFVSQTHCPGVAVERNLKSHIIGKGGNYTAGVRKGNKAPEGLVDAVQDVLDEFTDENKIIGDGEHEWFFRGIRDGETMVSTTPIKRGPGIVDAREIEPPNVRDPGHPLYTEAELQKRFGIYINCATNWAFGVHKADHDVQKIYGYAIDWSTVDGDWDYLPAGYMEHWKRNTDRNISRGRTDFFPAWQWLREQHRLLTNTSAGSAERAAISYIVEHVEGVTESQARAMRQRNSDYSYTIRGPQGNANTVYKEWRPPGTKLDVPLGQHYIAIANGTDPSPSYLQVVQAILRQIGVIWCMCHDSETECLTDSGWKKYHELTLNTRIATMNPETGRIEFQKPSKIHVTPYAGPMVRIKNQGLDMLVTPNHRMYLKQRKPVNVGGKCVDVLDKEYAFMQADSLLLRKKRSNFMPFVRAESEHEDPQFITIPNRDTHRKSIGAARPRSDRTYDMRAFVNFLGYWLPEGWVGVQKKERGYNYRVGLAQTEPSPDFAGIRESIRMFGFKIYESVREAGKLQACGKEVNASRCYQWVVMDKSLCLWLIENCGKGARNKKIPTVIKSLSPELLNVLLENMIAGDGSRVSDRLRVYYTSSRQLADDVQEIAIKCGYFARITKSRAMYQVRIRKLDDDRIGFSRKDIGLHEYLGDVWCCTVPNGLMVTRRNDTVAVTGNSEAMISGDDSGGSVTAAVVSGSRFDKYATMEQGSFAGFMGRVCWKVLRIAYNMGKFARWGFGQGTGSWQKFKRLIEIIVKYPDVANRDPQQQEQIRQTRQQAGILSLKTWSDEVDLDYETEQANKAKEQPQQQPGMPGAEGGQPGMPGAGGPGDEIGAGGQPGMPPDGNGAPPPLIDDKSHGGMVAYHKPDGGIGFRRSPGMGNSYESALVTQWLGGDHSAKVCEQLDLAIRLAPVSESTSVVYRTLALPLGTVIKPGDTLQEHSFIAVTEDRSQAAEICRQLGDRQGYVLRLALESGSRWLELPDGCKLLARQGRFRVLSVEVRDGIGHIEARYDCG